MRGLLVVASVGALAWLSGCGETCQSTCQHVYDPAECGIELPGVTPETLIKSCNKECASALQKVGEQRFDPATTPAQDDAWTLDNEAEASAWIDCVWEQVPDDGKSAACGNIDPQQGGICAPI